MELMAEHRVFIEKDNKVVSPFQYVGRSSVLFFALGTF